MIIFVKTASPLKCCDGASINEIQKPCAFNITCDRGYKCGRLETSSANRNIVVRSCVPPGNCLRILNGQEIASSLRRFGIPIFHQKFSQAIIECCDDDFCNEFGTSKGTGFIALIFITVFCFTVGLFLVLGVFYKVTCVNFLLKIKKLPQQIQGV